MFKTFSFGFIVDVFVSFFVLPGLLLVYFYLVYFPLIGGGKYQITENDYSLVISHIISNPFELHSVSISGLIKKKTFYTKIFFILCIPLYSADVPNKNYSLAQF